MNISSTLSTQKLNVARNICNALRSKRLKLSNSIFPETLEFRVDDSKCNESKTSDIVSAAVAKSGSRYRFVPNGVSTAYIRESIVQTDEDGSLDDLCNGILNDDDIELVDYESSTIVRVIDFLDDNKFMISRGVRSPTSDQFMLREKFIYEVNLSSSTNRYGYIDSRKHETECSGNTSGVITALYERKIIQFIF